ncbi:hypothetical protein D3C72_1773010 [compost metagenome]
MPGGPGLQPQGFVEQNHLEQLTVYREKRQQGKAEAPTTADQAALDVVLPGSSVPPIVHPHAQPQHHDTGEQRRAAFKQFTLCTTDVDDIGRQRPGGKTSHQCQRPADVDATHRRLLTSVAQEGKNRRQHQDRLQAFAQ